MLIKNLLMVLNVPFKSVLHDLQSSHDLHAWSQEDDNYLVISPVQARSGLSLDLIFMTTPDHQPLCLADGKSSDRNLQLLVHQVCRDSGFPTFSSFDLVQKQSVRIRDLPGNSSVVSCGQSKQYQIMCSISRGQDRCQYLVQVTCSSCHYHYSIGPNHNITILSPLYPVLQPNFICEYDFFVDSQVKTDLDLLINDLSLPGHQYSQGHDSKYNYQQ